MTAGSYDGEQRYVACVAMCLVTNNDQRGYDLASAIAAVDAMLEDGQTLDEVYSRLAIDMAALMSRRPRTRHRSWVREPERARTERRDINE